MHKFLLALMLVSSAVSAEEPFLIDTQPSMTQQEIYQKMTRSSAPLWVKKVEFDEKVNEEKSAGALIC